MKNPLPYAEAKRIADRVIEALQPHCKRLEIAGSIRRECPKCGDIDLVAQGITPAFRERLFAKTTTLANGQKNISVLMPNDFGIQIFIADENDTDLLGTQLTHDTWGTLLLCRTGSKAHNIQLASYAISKGLHWNPYKGLYNRKTLLAAATEESIYEALGLPFHPPTERERLTT